MGTEYLSERDEVLSIVIPFLKDREKFSARAYPDGTGYTYGYGHNGCGENDTITEPDASALLLVDAGKFYDSIEPLIPNWLNPNQIAALVSLSYNIGLGNFSRSTLLQELRELPPIITPDQMHELSNQFLRWVHYKGEVSSMLVTRRELEIKLFKTPYIPEKSYAQS